MSPYESFGVVWHWFHARILGKNHELARNRAGQPKLRPEDYDNSPTQCSPKIWEKLKQLKVIAMAGDNSYSNDLKQ